LKNSMPDPWETTGNWTQGEEYQYGWEKNGEISGPPARGGCGVLAQHQSVGTGGLIMHQRVNKSHESKRQHLVQRRCLPVLRSTGQKEKGSEGLGAGGKKQRRPGLGGGWGVGRKQSNRKNIFCVLDLKIGNHEKHGRKVKRG